MKEGDKMYIVYQHKNKTNGKMYFGITSRKPSERWGRDGSGYKSTPHFFSAIMKYGWDNFEHNIVREGLTKEEACQLERQLINNIKLRIHYVDTTFSRAEKPLVFPLK